MQPQSLQKNLLSCHQVVFFLFFPEVKNHRHQIWLKIWSLWSNWVKRVVGGSGAVEARALIYSRVYWLSARHALHPQNTWPLFPVGGNLSGLLNPSLMLDGTCWLVSSNLMVRGLAAGTVSGSFILYLWWLVIFNQSIKLFWFSSKSSFKCCWEGSSLHFQKWLYLTGSVKAANLEAERPKSEPGFTINSSL